MHKGIKILSFTVKKVQPEITILGFILNIFRKRTSFKYKVLLLLEESVGANYLLLLPSGVKLEVTWALNNTAECFTLKEFEAGVLEKYKPEVCYIITKQWIKH